MLCRLMVCAEQRKKGEWPGHLNLKPGRGRTADAIMKINLREPLALPPHTRADTDRALLHTDTSAAPHLPAWMKSS